MLVFAMQFSRDDVATGLKPRTRAHHRQWPTSGARKERAAPSKRNRERNGQNRFVQEIEIYDHTKD
jgi:hypothetical protein